MTLADDGTWDPLTFVEIRSALVSLWKQAYGDNADTDPNTPDGLEITILAGQMALAFDVDTQLWASSFMRSATGNALDRILDLFRKVREPATKSTGTAVFYGTPTTAIPAGTTVITSDTAANRFLTDAIASVGAASNSDAWVVRIQEPIAVGDSYIVQINANPALPTVAAPLDTPTLVATAMRDDINGQGFATAVVAGTDIAGSALIAIEIVGGPGNVATTATGSALLDDLEAVRTAVTAADTGALLASAGTLQTLSNPIVGITGVSNDADATPGGAEESDDEFRARHLETLFANTARTDSSIRSAVSAIAEMVEVNVTSNRSEVVDALGRDPHSVEVTFLHPDPTSIFGEVADAVASQIAAGIKPHGLVNMGFGTTPDGEVVDVDATPVEILYLWILITLTKGESFPTTGNMEAAVAAAVANYFDTGLLSTETGDVFDVPGKLVIGKNMLRTACPTPINLTINSGAQMIGILTDTTPLPTDTPVFGATDQPANDRQIVVADASRITVVIV